MSTIDKLCQFLMMLHHKKFPIEQGATKKNMETKPMAEIVSQQIGKKPKKKGKKGAGKKRGWNRKMFHVHSRTIFGL